MSDTLVLDHAPGRTSTASKSWGGAWLGLRQARGFAERGRSTLPDLAGEVSLPLILLDPTNGVCGLANQIRDAASYFDCDELIVVDVGGDILALGREPGLRSPIADFMSLAAAVRSALSSEILVTGIGLDGELESGDMLARLHALNTRVRGRLAPIHYEGIADVFEWHPSEANGLLVAAANGRRGLVETGTRACRSDWSATARLSTVFTAAAPPSSLRPLNCPTRAR